jgi:hypothetical protein
MEKKNKLDSSTLVVVAVMAFIVLTIIMSAIGNSNIYHSYHNYFEGQDFNMKEYLKANGWDNIKIYESAIQDHGPYREDSVPCIYANKSDRALCIAGENITVTDYSHPIYSEKLDTSDLDSLVSITELNPNCKMYSSSIKALDSLIRNKCF